MPLNRFEPVPGDPSAGHVYYIRLKTHVGICYKLGFTTMTSPEARLSYGGSNDHKLIDKTLLFKYMDNAYQVEQRAHKAFAFHYRVNNSSVNPGLPFFMNGQSELYFEDILGLDDEYLGSSAEAKAKKREKEKEKTDDLGIQRMLSPDLFRLGYDQYAESSKVLAILAGIGTYLLGIAMGILAFPILIWEIYDTWKDNRDPVKVERRREAEWIAFTTLMERQEQCRAIKKLLLS